jgi:hypothetical protein
MTLGAPDKKRTTILLAVLSVAAAYAVYSNFFDEPSVSRSSSRAAVQPAADEAPVIGSGSPSTQSTRAASRGRSDEFLPALSSPRKEDQINPITQDPTLRIDLLAKLQDVPAAGGGRDLFNFGKQPVATEALNKNPEPIVRPFQFIGPPKYTPPAAPSGPPPPPPPPPINLKYYGILQELADGKKTACFMDGDEILVETEGATFKGRYKLVRIGINSAIIEDLQYKRQQTLQLAEDTQG